MPTTREREHFEKSYDVLKPAARSSGVRKEGECDPAAGRQRPRSIYSTAAREKQLLTMNFPVQSVLLEVSLFFSCGSTPRRIMCFLLRSPVIESCARPPRRPGSHNATATVENTEGKKTARHGCQREPKSAEAAAGPDLASRTDLEPRTEGQEKQNEIACQIRGGRNEKCF